MTDMLTTDELIEHIRTALGGVGPQQVKRVLKAVGVLAHRERAALARAESAEAEAAEARAANGALAELAASETERRVALAERVAELEAALASADDETASASAQAARFWRTNNKLAERVAELEAQLAAQQWRPVTERPKQAGEYAGYDGNIVRCVSYDSDWNSDDEWPWIDMDGSFTPVEMWHPLPPPPAAAQEPTP